MTPPRSPGSGELPPAPVARVFVGEPRDQPRLALSGIFGVGFGDVQVALRLWVRQQWFGARDSHPRCAPGASTPLATKYTYAPSSLTPGSVPSTSACSPTFRSTVRSLKRARLRRRIRRGPRGAAACAFPRAVLRRLLRARAVPSVDWLVSGQVSVKNTREPSLEAAWKCTSSRPSPRSSSLGFADAFALRGVDLDRFFLGRVAHVQRAFFAFVAPEHARAVLGDRAAHIAGREAEVRFARRASDRRPGQPLTSFSARARLPTHTGRLRPAPASSGTSEPNTTWLRSAVAPSNSSLPPNGVPAVSFAAPSPAARSSPLCVVAPIDRLFLSLQAPAADLPAVRSGTCGCTSASERSG